MGHTGVVQGQRGEARSAGAVGRPGGDARDSMVELLRVASARVGARQVCYDATGHVSSWLRQWSVGASAGLIGLRSVGEFVQPSRQRSSYHHFMDQLSLLSVLCALCHILTHFNAEVGSGSLCRQWGHTNAEDAQSLCYVDTAVLN